MIETTTSLSCPQCGGRNQLPSGDRVLHCAFCDAALFVDRSGLVSHYRLPRLLGREQAIEALRRWMAGNETVKDLDRLASVETGQALAFPLWLFRMSGSDNRTEMTAGGSSRMTGDRAMGDPGHGEHVRVEPAAPTPVPQLAELKIPAGKLVPFDAAEVDADAPPASGGAPEEGPEVLPATVPLETARGWLGPAAEQVREAALVHVPLWQFHYRFGGQQYTALVDASTGSVLASVFPEKAETPFYLLFGLGLAIFLLEGLLVFNPVVKAFLFAITALPLIGIAYWIARKV